MTIKDLRTASGMTQLAFANLLGIPKRTVQNWECGFRPCPSYVEMLVEHFLRSENLI